MCINIDVWGINPLEKLRTPTVTENVKMVTNNYGYMYKYICMENKIKQLIG